MKAHIYRENKGHYKWSVDGRHKVFPTNCRIIYFYFQQQHIKNQEARIMVTILCLLELSLHASFGKNRGNAGLCVCTKCTEIREGRRDARKVFLVHINMEIKGWQWTEHFQKNLIDKWGATKLKPPFVECSVFSERACHRTSVSSGIRWKQSVGSLARVKVVMDQTGCRGLWGEYAPTKQQKIQVVHFHSFSQ